MSREKIYVGMLTFRDSEYLFPLEAYAYTQLQAATAIGVKRRSIAKVIAAIVKENDLLDKVQNEWHTPQNWQDYNYAIRATLRVSGKKDEIKVGSFIDSDVINQGYFYKQLRTENNVIPFLSSLVAKNIASEVYAYYADLRFRTFKALIPFSTQLICPVCSELVTKHDKVRDKRYDTGYWYCSRKHFIGHGGAVDRICDKWLKERNQEIIDDVFNQVDAVVEQEWY